MSLLLKCGVEVRNSREFIRSFMKLEKIRNWNGNMVIICWECDWMRVLTALSLTTVIELVTIVGNFLLVCQVSAAGQVLSQHKTAVDAVKANFISRSQISCSLPNTRSLLSRITSTASSARCGQFLGVSCLSICLSVGHTGALQNSWTDQDTVCRADLRAPKKSCIKWDTIIDFPNTGITYNGGWCSATIPRWNSI